MEKEHILTENPSRFVIFPLKYHDIWELYKTEEHSFWTAEEIDLSQDITDWEDKLNDNEIIANMKIEDILLYLNIDIKKTYKISSTQIKQQEKISYQELLFNKIYNIKTNLNIINYLGLEFYNWCRLSLVILLDYVLCHQPKLLEYLIWRH